jgi:hypothetical protein
MSGDLHFLLSSLLPQALELYQAASDATTPDAQKAIADQVRTEDAVVVARPHTQQSLKLRETTQAARKQIESLKGQDLSLKDQAWLLEKLDQELEKRHLPKN